MSFHFLHNRGRSDHNILNASNYRKDSKGRLERVRPRARSGPPAGYRTRQDSHGFLHAYAGDHRGNFPVDPALRAPLVQPQPRPYPHGGPYRDPEYVLHSAPRDIGKRTREMSKSRTRHGSSNQVPYQGGPYYPNARGGPEYDPNLYVMEGGRLIPRKQKHGSGRKKASGGYPLIPTPKPYGPPRQVPVYGDGRGYLPADHPDTRHYGRSQERHKSRGRDIRDDQSPGRSSSYSKHKNNNNKINTNSFNTNTTHHHNHHHYHGSSGSTSSKSKSSRIKNWIDSTHSGSRSSRSTNPTTVSSEDTLRWPGRQHRRGRSPDIVVRPHYEEIAPRRRYGSSRAASTDDSFGRYRRR